ncbi:MAG: undecaprenyl-diphosphate phosphatase [Candidatus Cryptobacteroides sp.]
MSWWQALILGIVQGLTEFLPVSSSGHLMIFREIVGADPDGFLGFTVMVHFATVLSTVIVFWSAIVSLFRGLFKFRYNDETDYICKIIVSMVPVAIVGFFLKDKVEALFGDSLFTVAVCLVITAVLLFISDHFSIFSSWKKRPGDGLGVRSYRNGISYWQAFVVGLGQAFAVAPGLSRSGTTISTGLVCGVKREVMAQFSFLMVLVPIVGEQLLQLLDVARGEAVFAEGIGAGPMIAGFLAAFFSGLFACRVMVALVKKAKLTWFALYCLVVALVILCL